MGHVNLSLLLNTMFSVEGFKSIMQEFLSSVSSLKKKSLGVNLLSFYNANMQANQ